MIKDQHRSMFIFIFFILTAVLSAQEYETGGFSYTNDKGGSMLFNSGEPAGLKLNAPLKYSSAFHTAVSEGTSDPDIKIYSGLGDNILNSFKGNNLYFHLAGAASTALIAASSTDYYIHKYFNEHEQYGFAARPVIRAAQYFPFAIAGSLYAYGKLNTDNEAVGAAFAVLQSSLIAVTYNSLLKALTGRPNPRWREKGDMEEMSKTFRFGFWRGGIFWGWPSGHTSSTMAVVSALASFYPDKTWLKIAGYSYVAYMMFAVSSLNRGGMHWFSDAVAAAFMSYAIGSTVGKYYRDRFTETEKQAPPAGYIPQNLPGLSLTIHF